MFTEIAQGADPSALHELPSGGRQHPLQGVGPSRAYAAGVARRRRLLGAIGTDLRGYVTHDANFAVTEATTYKSIPGHPRWGLAPLSMAWQGKSIGDICRQVKDVNRNGGRDLALLQEHIAKDDLVAWGWNPGPGREPAPGSQEAAGKLVQAWIDTGAECP